VKTAMNPRISYSAENIFIIWEAIHLGRRTQLHDVSYSNYYCVRYALSTIHVTCVNSVHQ
jgi:hypothetical protein